MRLKLVSFVIGLALILAACSIDPTTPEQEQNSIDLKEDNQPQVIEPEQNGENKEDLLLTLDAKFFNKVQNVNGQPTIMNPENILVLVNKEVALQQNYIPTDLVRPNVPLSFGNQQLEKSFLRKDAAIALENMFAEAKENGIELIAASGYRSYETQAFLFNREIDKVGREKAELAVARPGMSEHQTGLTMDITSASMNYGLSEQFENKTEGQWLINHAHEFGFIMRYPKGKEEITKYQYEPWHYRYVGVDVAKKIHENGWTLEEYFNNVKKI